jgi:hypothetical protein
LPSSTSPFFGPQFLMWNPMQPGFVEKFDGTEIAKLVPAVRELT